METNRLIQFGDILVFIVRIIQNTYVYFVGKILRVLQIVYVVHIVTVGPRDVILTNYKTHLYLEF